MRVGRKGEGGLNGGRVHKLAKDKGKKTRGDSVQCLKGGESVGGMLLVRSPGPIPGPRGSDLIPSAIT